MNIVYQDKYGNKIIGSNPSAKLTKVNFNGKNNILYCENEVSFDNSNITFNGDNSLAYFSTNSCDYKIDLSLYHDSVFHIGCHCYINTNMIIVLSERKHCFIGDKCILSSGINIRNADAHLIYDCSSKERINPTKSIYIGDHVWIGQNVFILKGTQIDSGSIIGAMSVVANKKIGHNESWAGNPCKNINKNIFWDNMCVHRMTNDDTIKFMDYRNYANETSDRWIYYYDKHEVIEWNELENVFSSDVDCVKKLEYLVEVNAKSCLNRFVHL